VAAPLIRASGAATPGGRVSDDVARGLVAVAGVAPAPLLARAERIGVGAGRGIVVELRDGPDLVFGSAVRARAKWVAAGAVLADSSSRGAAYLDLRIPERPAAGGLGAETIQPVVPPGETPDAAPQAAPPQAAPADPQPQPQVEGTPGA